MPALNGDTAVDSSQRLSTINSAKRKRSQSTEKPIANGSSTSTTSPLDHDKKSVRDICTVLQSYDTDPSILAQPLPSQHASKEPTPKRAKLSNPQEPRSVLDRVHQDKYETLERFQADFDTAASEALLSVRPPPKAPDPSSQWKFAPDSLEPDRFAAHLNVLQSVAKDLFRREAQRLAKTLATDTVDEKQEDASQLVNGDTEKSPQSTTLDGKTVLTLFGNASGHKQLFSSFQKPLPKHMLTGEKASQAPLPAAYSAVMPLRESGLPNQIFSTQIVPVDPQSALPLAKRNAKFRDLFKAPASLLPLNPPKPSKHSRSSTITWTREDDTSDSTGYSHAKLPTGHWLGYNGVAPTQEPTTPEAKRKQRDRALSMGESTPAVTEEIKAGLAKAKEEALFRSAYSSFAPCRDDSMAIVPEEVRGQVWWQRRTEQRLPDAFAEEADYGDDDTPMTNGVAHDDQKDAMAQFEEMIAQIDPELEELDVFPKEFAEDESKVDSILEQISELLETLQSHQRIRHSSLGPGARSNLGQASSLTETSASSSSTLTEAEKQVYTTSRDRLVALISKLPPYAMSKVNGHQLSDLIIGRQIIAEGKDYQGVLGEDHFTRQQQAAALQAALGNAPGRNISASGSRPGTFSQSRSNTQTQAYNAASRPTPSTARTPYSGWTNPANSIGRPPYTQQNQGYGRTPAPLTNRPGYSQSTAYPQSPSQPAYQQRAQNFTGSGINMHSPYARNASSLQPQTGTTRYTLPAARPAYTAQSPLPPTSPYQAPPATMTAVQGSSGGSRPQTPATPKLQQPGSAAGDAPNSATKSATGTPQ